MKKALILLSGGQDSTTCLFWAKSKFDKLIAVGFDYNQRHIIELECAKKICDNEKIQFEIIKLNKILSNSALIDKNKDLNTNHPSNKNLPNSFVPGRNLIFLSIASTYAVNNNINDIVIGVCEADYSGYPDCRKKFVDSIKDSILLCWEGISTLPSMRCFCLNELEISVILSKSSIYSLMGFNNREVILVLLFLERSALVCSLPTIREHFTKVR